MLFIFHKNVVFIVFNPVYGNFILTRTAKQHILDNSKRPAHSLYRPHRKKACAHNVPAA